MLYLEKPSDFEKDILILYVTDLLTFNMLWNFYVVEKSFAGLKWSQKLKYNRMFLNPTHGVKFINCQAVNAGSVMSIRAILLRSHLLTNIKYFKEVWRSFSVEILPSF